MALDRALAAFLAREASRRWDMQTHNCGLWLADWYMAATGAEDPAANLRGRYGAAWERPGAVLKHLRGIAARLDFMRVTAPLPGDVAALSLRWHDGRRRAVGAIKCNGGWVVPPDAPCGFSRLPDEAAAVIAAWRFPECLSSQPSSLLSQKS